MSAPPSIPKFSIIIPVYNEAVGIAAALHPLQSLRDAGHEIIVVDGGSEDQTLNLARTLAEQALLAARGRARQMNAGAAVANGEFLLFLHADTGLPEQALLSISKGLLKDKKLWGRFDVRLSGTQPLLRVVEFMMNWRSRLSGIATGDQAMFVRRDCFQAVGGFPDMLLMEDIALSRLLKKHSTPLCLRERVITSSRRWEQHGILRTILLMWRLRLAYALGADPQQLARIYQRK